MSDEKCDIGLVGLGIMGKNFALNMSDKGYRVGVYNRTEEKTRRFMKEKVEHRPIAAGYSLDEFVELLKRPGAILIFVSAGKPVDEVIDELTPRLDAGDLIIDCGNSHFKDTDRRTGMLDRRGLLFLGMGVSGGGSGARHGPSLMPGGSAGGYERVREILEASAARVNGDPCITYLGPGSAGHYVKMVHNGIEYGIMQLIAESYDLLKRGLGMEIGKLPGIYERWNRGKLNSYLIEITARILRRMDDRTGNPLIEMILDHARQKGTGKWTSQDSMDLMVPVPAVDAAVAMRNMSVRKDERKEAGGILEGPPESYRGDPEIFVNRLEKGLSAAEVITYAQGMSLLKQASQSYGYNLDMEAVARIWRGGCIIRAAMLESISGAFRKQPDLENLILSPLLGKEVTENQEALRTVVRTGVDLGIPVPGFMSSLAYYDAYRSTRLPADLIMAQRDYFGAHMYERVDAEGMFHTEWDS